MSENNDNGHLRGVIPNAETYRDVVYWKNQYRSQDKARSDLKLERLRSGGEESVLRSIAVEYDDIDDVEPVKLSASGLLLETGVHRISGPAGKGKTRFAYWEALQRIQNGKAWAILDAEMGAGRFKQTMLQLGARREDFDSILYMDAYNNITPDLIEHGGALVRMLDRDGYDGILYDSQVAFLGASGLSENDAAEVREWVMRATSGIGCAIILDHTGHSDESRGRGTSDKAAGCDVDMVMKVLSPFSIGIPGEISITVNKDRSGTFPVGASIPIEVECLTDGTMDFMPGRWDMEPEYSENDSIDVAEIIDMLLIRPEFGGRDYVTASELQGAIKGVKTKRLSIIRKAVEDGSIIERKDGKSKHYYAAG